MPTPSQSVQRVLLQLEAAAPEDLAAGVAELARVGWHTEDDVVAGHAGGGKGMFGSEGATGQQRNAAAGSKLLAEKLAELTPLPPKAPPPPTVTGPNPSLDVLIPEPGEGEDGGGARVPGGLDASLSAVVRPVTAEEHPGAGRYFDPCCEFL